MRRPDTGRSSSPSPDRPSPPERGVRRRLPPAERRASILAAALPCFATRGYLGAGTRDLARAAAVTEPILYRHFAGKAGLFRAVLEAAAERLVAQVAATCAAGAGADARLQGLAAALPRIIDDCQAELRVLNAGALAVEEPEIRAATAEACKRIGQALSAAFEGKGLRDGVAAETAGFLLLEIGLGASMMRPLGVTEIDSEAFSMRAVDILLRGLART